MRAAEGGSLQEGMRAMQGSPSAAGVMTLPSPCFTGWVVFVGFLTFLWPAPAWLLVLVVGKAQDS